jgi:predicted nuclease of predicted toxin-antitoxin system
MRIVLDEGLALRAADALRRAGIDAVHVLELGLRGAPDHVLMARAVEEGAAIATLDSDFHQILARTGAQTPSVIRIRIEGLNGAQLAVLLQSVLERTEQDLLAGSAVSVSATTLRLRRLPLGKR